MLDFSVNTNPLGMPKTVVNMDKYLELNNRYPDPDCKELRERLAEKYCADCDDIFCGNGADDIIYRITQALKPDTATIAAPTYEEYADALEASGCRNTAYYLYKEENDYRLDDGIFDSVRGGLFWICNPNNPTGELISKEKILRLAEVCGERDTVLAVDESFMGFVCDEAETAKELIYKYDNLIVIDAFTKSYSMPGFRLGFCLSSNRELLEKVKKAGQKFPVSAYAQTAGLLALEDKGYLKRTAAFVAKERKFVSDGLKECGLKVYESATDFILVKSPYEGFVKRLSAENIRVRNLDKMAGLNGEHFRIAVKERDKNKRLIESARKITAELQD